VDIGGAGKAVSGSLLYFPVAVTVLTVISSLVAGFIALTGPLTSDILSFNFNLLGQLFRITPGPLDVIAYCQFISSTGQLALYYPSGFASVTASYSWSNFIFGSSILNSAANSAHPSIVASVSASSSSSSISSNLQRRSFTLGMDSAITSRLIADNSTTILSSPQQTSAVKTESGLASYAARVGIAPNNLFIVTLIGFTLALAAFGVLFILGAVILEILVWKWPGKFNEFHKNLPKYLIGKFSFSHFYFFSVSEFLYVLTEKELFL